MKNLLYHPFIILLLLIITVSYCNAQNQDCYDVINSQQCPCTFEDVLPSEGLACQKNIICDVCPKRQLEINSTVLIRANMEL